MLSPSEKWDFIRKIHIFILKFVGVQFMDENFKPHNRTLIPVLIQAYYYVCLINSFIYYRNEPSKAIIATTPLALFVSVIS